MKLCERNGCIRKVIQPANGGRQKRFCTGACRSAWHRAVRADAAAARVAEVATALFALADAAMAFAATADRR